MTGLFPVEAGHSAASILAKADGETPVRASIRIASEKDGVVAPTSSLFTYQRGHADLFGEILLRKFRLLRGAPSGEGVFVFHFVRLSRRQLLFKGSPQKKLALRRSIISAVRNNLGHGYENWPIRPVRHFLKEWRKHRGLTQQQLADRLPSGDDGKPTGKDVVSRWERNERGISMDVQAALAEALSIAPADLFRDPAMPSADDLLRNALG
jgi:hypothetical protein